MTPDQINNLINTLLETGKFLGTKAFELAIRQVMIGGWLDIVCALLLTIAGIVFYILGKKSDDSDWEAAGTIAVLTLPLIGVLMTISGLQQLLNPEWYAVKLLIGTFLGK